MENTLHTPTSEISSTSTPPTTTSKTSKCTPCQLMLVFGIALSLFWVVLLFVNPFGTKILDKSSIQTNVTNKVQNSVFADRNLPITFEYPNSLKVEKDFPELSEPLYSLIDSSNTRIMSMVYTIIGENDTISCDRPERIDPCEIVQVNDVVIQIDKSDPTPTALIRITENSTVLVMLEKNETNYQTIFNDLVRSIKYQKTNNDTEKPSLAKECREKGGVWQSWGLAQEEYCQIPASDAGKSCLDGSECSLGNCVSENGQIPGKCQTFPQAYGCFSYIQDGAETERLCVD